MASTMAVVSPGGLVLSMRTSDRHSSKSSPVRDSTRAARRALAAPGLTAGRGSLLREPVDPASWSQRPPRQA